MQIKAAKNNKNKFSQYKYTTLVPIGSLNKSKIKIISCRLIRNKRHVCYRIQIQLPRLGKYGDQPFDIFHSCVNIIISCFVHLLLQLLLIVDYFHWECLLLGFDRHHISSWEQTLKHCSLTRMLFNIFICKYNVQCAESAAATLWLKHCKYTNEWNSAK